MCHLVRMKFESQLLLTLLSCAAAVSTDGVRVSWKDNFESHYTDVVELGR